MNKNSKIFIAGHLGMVGSACMRLLKKEGYNNIICKTRSELDLTKQEQLLEHPKDFVHIVAASCLYDKRQRKNQMELVYL